MSGIWLACTRADLFKLDGGLSTTDEERTRVEAAWEEYLRAHEQDRQFRQLAEAGAIHDDVGLLALADRSAELGLNELESHLRYLAQGWMLRNKP